MEQLSENNTEQENQTPVKPPVSLGKMLIEERERLGMSVADVAAQIKFAPRQIEALEADDFEHLPETAFLRGFVRSYAKILHLDAQTLLSALPQSESVAAEQIPAPVNVPFPVAHSSQRQNMILLGAAMLLALIVTGLAVWHFTSPAKHPNVVKLETPVSLPAEIPAVTAPLDLKQDKVETSVAAGSKSRTSAAAEKSSTTAEKSLPLPAKATAIPAKPAPVQTAIPAKPAPIQTAIPAKPAPVQVVPKTQETDTEKQSDSTTSLVKMRFVFDVESWAEIKDKDGNILSSRVHEAGSEMRLGGQPPLSLVIGHAGSVHLFKNGELVDLAPYTNASSEVARLTLE